MADIPQSYPKVLSYNLRRLQGSFSKNQVKVIPDNQSATPNSITRFRIVGNGLYDLRTVALHIPKATASQTNTGANDPRIHFPRYSSSLIENITITANNAAICSYQGYNYLYNMINDLEASDFSQLAKRNTAGENFDPTLAVSSANDATNCALTVANRCLLATGSTTSLPLCINNWLFFNSLSTPIVDLSTIGDLFITITWANSSVLWHSGNANTITAAQTISNPTYTLSDMFMTVSRCQFSDPLYYTMLTEKLLGDGLSIGYHDWFYTSFSTVANRTNGVSLSWSVNSQSLDRILVSFKHSQANNVRPLIMYGANHSTVAEAKTWAQVLADPVGSANQSASAIAGYNIANLGDTFANSVFFLRNASSITGSKFNINSIDIDPWNLTPLEIFQKYLQHDGMSHLDAGGGYVNPACYSLEHFKKYFFVDSCSLDLIAPNDNYYWVSGLNGQGTSLVIQYNANFETTGNTTSVQPVAYCRSTNILRIKAGRQLQVNPPIM